MDDFVGYHGLETPIARSLIKLPQLPTQLHPLVVPSFGQSFLGSQAKRRFLVVSWSSQIPAGQPLRLVKDSSGGHENVNSWSRKGSLGFCIFRPTMPGGELEFCSCKWPFSGPQGFKALGPGQRASRGEPHPKSRRWPRHWAESIRPSLNTRFFQNNRAEAAFHHQYEHVVYDLCSCNTLVNSYA